jgi:uracil-DNA glycosylase
MFMGSDRPIDHDSLTDLRERMEQGTSRANSDENVVDAKNRHLRDAHIAPFTDLVQEIRRKTGNEFVPFVDPTLGGINARVLFVLENPARPAALSNGKGSGMLSPDNDDGTAENLWKWYLEASLPRSMAMHWNAVPWFTGDERRNKSANRSSVIEGVPWLVRVIRLLPQLRLAVAMGGPARWAAAFYQDHLDVKPVRWLEAPHPGNRVRNRYPEQWVESRAAFHKAAEICLSPRSDDVTAVIQDEFSK